MSRFTPPGTLGGVLIRPMNTDLLAYALNLLGAHDDGGCLTAEDSFGEVHVWPGRRGLQVQDCRAGQPAGAVTVTSQRALRDALMPRAPLNAAGLTRGSVLTRLGPLTFTVNRLRVQGDDTRLHLRLDDHPLTLGGVLYDAFSTACTGVKPTSNLPSVVRRAATGSFDLPGTHARHVLWDLVHALYPQLVTPRAAWRARVEEAQVAVQTAEAALRQAQGHLSSAREALGHLEAHPPPLLPFGKDLHHDPVA